MWVLLFNLCEIQRQTWSSSDDHCSSCQHNSKFHKTQGEANVEHVETAEDIGAGFVFLHSIIISSVSGLTEKVWYQKM